MKIYCAGPIRGDTTWQKYYLDLTVYISSLGHTAYNEFNQAAPEIKETANIYDRDMKWLNDSECMIAEVSGPSTGVGYEIATALLVKKIPVLALHYTEAPRLSAMISDNRNNLLQIKKYGSKKELRSAINKFINAGGKTS